MPIWLVWLLTAALVTFAFVGLLRAVRRYERRNASAGRTTSTGDGGFVPVPLNQHQSDRVTREGDGHGQDSPSSDSGGDGGGGD